MQRVLAALITLAFLGSALAQNITFATWGGTEELD
jgi:hypothetical protein